MNAAAYFAHLDSLPSRQAPAPIERHVAVVAAQPTAAEAERDSADWLEYVTFGAGPYAPR